MNKIFKKIRSFLCAVRDKPVEGEPVPPSPPTEPGEVANPSPEECASGQESVSVLGAASTSKTGADSALESRAESALETGAAAGAEAATPSPEVPATVDPAEEKQRNRQYKASLSSACMWMETRFECNMCPKEELSNFKILGRLGSGGYAEVFKVRYRAQDKVFALKVQNKRELAKRTFPSWAVREKKLMHAIQCEFVVQLHYAFKDARNLYLVMEYAPKGDLVRLYGMTLPERVVKLIAAQLVLGIEYLHACKICHRDIKGRNVFLCDDMYLKIGDFGLAKNFPVRTETSIGTPHYMAPEMFRQRGYRRGVDFWAMGILLFRLIYNDHPYAEMWFSREEIMEAAERGAWGFPREVYPNSVVNKFLSGLLEKNIHRRLGMMLGGADKVKAHEWFKDISFSAVLKKSERITVKLDPVQPEVFEKYEFIPAEGEEDFKPKAFEEF